MSCPGRKARGKPVAWPIWESRPRPLVAERTEPRERSREREHNGYLYYGFGCGGIRERRGGSAHRRCACSVHGHQPTGTQTNLKPNRRKPRRYWELSVGVGSCGRFHCPPEPKVRGSNPLGRIEGRCEVAFSSGAIDTSNTPLIRLYYARRLTTTEVVRCGRQKQKREGMHQ